MSRILLVAPVSTHPSATGASARVRYMAEGLTSLGHEVHFLHLQQPLRFDDTLLRQFWGDRLHICRSLTPGSFVGRARRKLIRIVGETLHLNLAVDSYHDTSAARSLTRLLSPGSFDVVILSYIFYSKLFESVSGSVYKVLDAHDIFSNRYLLYRQHGQANEFFSTGREDEQKALNRADVVLAIQQWDADFFRTLTIKPVEVVGHLAPVVAAAPARPTDPYALLFVGGPMGINLHGVTWFIDRVLPAVRRRVPEAELWLVGGIAERVGRAAPGVRGFGFVDRLGDLYRRAALVINPQQFGTGLSIKSVDALLHGRPLVTTASGARGLEDGSGAGFRQADTAEDFASTIVELLRDPIQRDRLAAGALDFAQAYHQRNLLALEAVVDRSATR
jgi:polysaccharide biosynthesis protein PslH